MRLEVFGPSGTKAEVRYSSDSKNTVQINDLPLPWAVEAPIVSTNTSLDLSSRDESSVPKAERAVLMCRIWLDGVMVEESVAHSRVSCDTSLSHFRAQPDRGDGAALTGATTLTPNPTTVPSVPSQASTATFEAYTSKPSSSMSIHFGTSGSDNRVGLDNQTMPWAQQAAIPPGVTTVSMNAFDYTADPPATTLCRILLDGVPVAMRLSSSASSCSVSADTH